MQLKIIVISPPGFINEEINALHLLFENGVHYFHLRKPEADKKSYAAFLKQIKPDFQKHIIIHNYFDLCKEYEIKGIHLNSSYKSLPDINCQHKSRSCHSLEEVIIQKPFYDYLFLSPIFDSISKKGYHSAFSDSELMFANEKQIVDNNVIALGGVNQRTISSVSTYGFGGAAVLGYLWDDFMKTQNFNTLLKRFLLLQQ
ncbi:MAG: thiamine phosphate synthase [Bacteroidales bacterium]